LYKNFKREEINTGGRKMNEHSLKKAVHVIVILFLFFSFSALASSQDKQPNDDKDKKLREEIVMLYSTGGKPALIDFFQKNRDKITNKFIVDFARAGVKERKEEWLKACEIMAEEKKDLKTLADVLFKTGEYFVLISNNKKAANYLNKALPIYIKLDDDVGQGNVYRIMGEIYLRMGKNAKAIEMYNKALPFFEKARYLAGQGNVCQGKGDIYYYSGDYSRAQEMYDKALTFFEKAGNITFQGNVYLRRGYIFYYLGEYTRALEMYDKAIAFFEKSGDPLGLGSVYHITGMTYLRMGENSRVLEMYDKALCFFRKVGQPVGLGNVYMSKGQFYLRVGENSKSLKMFDKAQLFFEEVGEPIGIGNIYWSKGNIYLRMGENSKALDMFDKALPLYKKAGISMGQGNVYKEKANIFLRTGENSKALDMFDKALYFFVKAGDAIGQGNVIIGKGTIYLRIGEHSKAFEMYDKALPLFIKVGYAIGQGNVYSSKGDIYFNNGDNSRALEMYDKALPLFKKVEDPIGQGDVIVGKGGIYLRTGENSKALKMYIKAMSFYEKAGYAIGQGNVFMRKGDIYFRTGEKLKALEMFEKALPFFVKAGTPIDQGKVYMKKGNIYFYTGNNLKALEMYEKALSLFKKVSYPFGLGNFYFSKGEIYFYDGDNSKTLDMLDKALPFFEKAGQLGSQGNVYLIKGDIYFGIGENSKALELYYKALSFYKKVEDNESESKALLRKAKVFAKNGKKGEAILTFEKAIAKLEKVRIQTAISEMKKSFLEKVYEQYEDVALFMLENGHFEKGFRYADSMKGRVFLDRMGEELIPLEKGLKPKLREEQDNLVARLSSISKRIYEFAGKDEKKLEELKEQYGEVEGEFEELLIKIRLENPLYAEVRYPQPVSVEDLQGEVLREGEILVRYFVAPEKVYVFLVSRDDFEVVPLGVGGEGLREVVEKYLAILRGNDYGEMRRYGERFYRRLFRPMEEKLKGREIVVVPDGPLAMIPFESLVVGRNGEGRPVYLMEKYRIKYIQSASILSILRKHYQQDGEIRGFIGFGDPVYDYENYKKGLTEKGSDIASPKRGDEIWDALHSRYVREGGIMSRLEQSGQEVAAIAQLFRDRELRGVVKLREEADEKEAKSGQMKDFDFIHFACHGILEDEFQCLALSQLPEEQSPEDGYFTLNEIMNCEYNARLVVLSACQSGKGKMERAEGVIGLTRAMMYAGTPAVVASLWDVDDEATRELMVRFYRYMLEDNLDKVEALRKAKLDLINNQKYFLPVYWSGLVMYGE
jgi:tetratricopeptide (TPR) repeat protein